MGYNETTVLNDTEVQLTAKEQAGVRAFHKSRIAFGVLPSGALAINVKDEREHRVYLKEDFGLTGDEIDDMVRGYIKAGKVNFYRTTKFLPVDSVTIEVLNELGLLCNEYFGAGTYAVGNGMLLGELGAEWVTMKNYVITTVSGVPAEVKFIEV